MIADDNIDVVPRCRKAREIDEQRTMRRADRVHARNSGLGPAPDADWPNVARWVATLKARPSYAKAHAGFYQMIGKALEPA